MKRDMNIYDLEKQASPGPWFVQRRNTRSYGNLPEVMSTPTQGITGVLLHNGDVNAALIVHCRNNFVKALKFVRDNKPDCHTCSDIENCDKWFDGECSDMKKWAKLVKELEQVKTGGDVNAAMIVHCRNNFVRALGALEAIAEEAKDMLNDFPEVAGIYQTALETAAELEKLGEPADVTDKDNE